jgi:hypothetical protein
MWFVDVADPDSFPPQQRHPGSHINPSTNGNEVELLVEGVVAFHDNAATGKGRLRLAPHTRKRPEFPYHFLMNKIIDPYSGPERAT